MTDIALILGPVVLQDFELAGGVRFGGEQRLAIHDLPGGGRVVDALGRNDSEITFSGIFSGSDATLRTRLLDEMRAFGAALPLTWDVFFYTVIIREFCADYQNSYWIPYQICCTVVRDDASALINTTASLAASILSDIGVAAGYLPAGVDIGATQLAVAAPGAGTRDTAAFGFAQSQIGVSLNAIDYGLSDDSGSLSRSGTALAGGADAGSVSRSLGSAVEAAARLSGLSTARGFVGRASFNLADAST